MVTIQSSSKNGAALVKYLLEEESHRDGTERNVYVTTVNLMPGKMMMLMDILNSSVMNGHSKERTMRLKCGT